MRSETAVCRSGQGLTPRRPGYWHGGRAGGLAGNVPTRAGFLGIRGRCSHGPGATLAGSEFLEAAYGRSGMETLIREVARICLPRLSQACPNLKRRGSLVSRSLVHATRQTPACEEAHFVPGSCDSILTGAVSDRAPGTSWDPVQPWAARTGGGVTVAIPQLQGGEQGASALSSGRPGDRARGRTDVGCSATTIRPPRAVALTA
jgi:hypothetical protein